MKGDIALVGFVLTAEEWQSLDSHSRAQLLAAAFQRDAPWIFQGSGLDSGRVVTAVGESPSAPTNDDENR